MMSVYHKRMIILFILCIFSAHGAQEQYTTPQNSCITPFDTFSSEALACCFYQKLVNTEVINLADIVPWSWYNPELKKKMLDATDLLKKHPNLEHRKEFINQLSGAIHSFSNDLCDHAYTKRVMKTVESKEYGLVSKDNKLQKDEKEFLIAHLFYEEKTSVPIRVHSYHYYKKSSRIELESGLNEIKKEKLIKNKSFFDLKTETLPDPHITTKALPAPLITTKMSLYEINPFIVALSALLVSSAIVYTYLATRSTINDAETNT